MRRFFHRIRDIGVRPEMRPEDAKYIRIFNAWVFFCLIVVFVIGLVSVGNGHWPNVVLSAAMEVALALVFLFLHRGRYTAARVYAGVIAHLYLVPLCLFSGPQVLFRYAFFATAAGAPLIFPRGERGWMGLAIGESVAGYIAVSLLSGWVIPLITWDPATAGYINLVMELALFISIVVIAFIGREGAHEAEDLLREAHDEVARLTGRLRVYLPQQFVAALAGDRQAAGPDHRRRRLTVFFSDIQGFTRWTDRLDPEDVREILNQYLAEMSGIAARHGGTLDKFIGDAIMIFFGDPVFTSDEDHARSAVRMALEMQAAMQRLREGWAGRVDQEPLHIRIGINTGWATVGSFGAPDRLNYTALGSAVNLASRLETACAPDAITLSHTTWSLVKDRIECRPLGEIEVKGFAEPVKIYEAVREL